MGDPRRHHFNPEFYLRQWAGADGLVCEIKKAHGKVEAQRKSPRATGFQRDLYRTEGVPDEYAQHVEKDFMSPLDNDSARALEKIISGDANWTGDERTAWTTFILSLLFRNPENVAIIKDHIRELWKAGDAGPREANYDERRRPADPSTFDGYMALTNPAAAEIGASNFLMETISNERLGPVIFNMHWTRHSLRHSKLELLMSDRPVIMPFGLGDPRAYIALAVSPSVLFVAARNPGFARSLSSLKHTDLVKVLNKAVVCQARKFVWATDESQLEFIRRHIATAPDRTIITEKQKREVLAATRGELPGPARE